MTLPPVYRTWLGDVERSRRASGLRRTLVSRSSDSPLLDLASNDYLGLTGHPEVVEGAVAATREWGAGATGSRLVTGTTDAHACLERELADFVGAESALVFSSGYTANLGVVTALTGRDALVVSDAAVHASLVDACRLSRARVQVTPHGDVDAVAAALCSRTEERAIVLTDSVFSTDGDLAPLRALHDVTSRHRALLVVDEAHGLGVRGDGGRGWVHESGLAGSGDVVVTATLSKSLAAQGGVVLAPEAVRAHLVDSARSFIFDTALAPAAVGAARAALGVLRREPDLPRRVLRRAAQLAAAAGVPGPRSAVVSVVLGNADRATDAAARCRDAGLHVGCFRPPSVPDGTSRLRLTARASLTDAETDYACAVLADVQAAAAA